MKTPPKPFIVEVKRSRSSSSVVQPSAVQPPVVVQAAMAAAPASPSGARQQAERMFMALTTGSSAGPEASLTVASVFGARAKPGVTAERSQEVPAMDSVGAASSAGKTVPPKPGRARAPKTTSSKASAEVPRTPVLPNAPALEATAVAAKAVRRHKRPKVAKALPPAAPAVQLPVEPRTAEPEQSNSGKGWGWGPGERWKKRLRHLR
jgi:hypothetical protein